ncbi:tRNA (adenosine(37)-N6)-threonylcarbamoyltransferase complex dimerization subunit type 1 TsaB [Tenuibacillus multivorans]|uniref:tRNA threonylcarbamoyladenosine biosynthesis protein TsaB n=1 Tax=Tenuibacillus multivorans TaxID=237069 RepID=A0A1H0E4U6_9BACI|nr:tRNA (adenosine(37)-N6)-threonylcarbamoyltransferase complex dimerization subunit type 1 TsaB [Tenuibacillus multivorans]GEL76653.1 tRNA threonylcarbamoyladenosine biosynthesis protein TsaB [Tenuibacillus multivorans]SDN77369.1 tRNA threonylcarbamoyladenosine biosynthesis protein TsaB [Tenuibacillus multivorans]
MNVLGIDTSNQPMSVAIYQDNQLVSELTVNIKRNHSIQLMPAVQQVMEQAGLKPKDLNEVVVAEGPGSFTGIRIGMTTAKTLAWTLNIPIKTVSSLKTLAGQLMYHKGYICPFFDARRGNVYTGLYFANHGQIKTIEADCNIDMEIWLKQLINLEEPILFTSPNGHNFNELIESILGENAILVNHSLNLPRAGILVQLGQDVSSADIHNVNPNYQRMTQAEANWAKQHEEGNSNE